MPTTFQLLATPEDSLNNALTGRLVTFQSDNTAIATVDNTGLITAIAVGVCNVTATSEGKTATCVVTVVPANNVATVTVAPVSGTLQVGGTLQGTASAFDISGNPISAPFTWTTSNGTIATVDSSGLITAVAAGSVIITATSGAASASISVTVVAAENRQLWFEADTLTLTDGTLVTNWADQSGNNIVATQTTTFNKPTYHTNEIGGEPGVDFELNAILKYADIDAAAFTRFVVAKIGTSTPTANMVLFNTPMSQCYVKPDGTIVLVINKTGGLIVEWESAAAAVTLNVPHIFEIAYDASVLTNNPTVHIDGGTGVTMTLFGGSQSGTRNSDAGTAEFGGDSGQSHDILGPLSAYIKYPDISSHVTERQRLATKYGITIT